jgi:prepilin-type N-terminal cleavage/methylation domain-containing protein
MKDKKQGGGDRMKNKNAGFSLIELIVVVAILAVLSTGVVITVLSSSSYGAQQVAKEIDSALTEARVQALSKSDAWIEIEYDDSLKKYVIKTSYASDLVLSGSSRITISYTKSENVGDAEVTTKVTSTDKLGLKYDRSTGAFKYIVTDVETGATDGSNYCRSIKISGGSKTYEIKLSQKTGRHTLSQ